MIGSYNCPIAGVQLHPTVWLQLCKFIRKNTAVYAPITCKEIVIVMIRTDNKFVIQWITRSNRDHYV